MIRLSKKKKTMMDRLRSFEKKINFKKYVYSIIYK